MECHLSILKSIEPRDGDGLFINQDFWVEVGLHDRQSARQRLLGGIDPVLKEKLEVDIQTPIVTADDKDKNYNDVEDEEEEQTEQISQRKETARDQIEQQKSRSPLARLNRRKDRTG